MTKERKVLYIYVISFTSSSYPFQFSATRQNISNGDISATEHKYLSTTLEDCRHWITIESSKLGKLADYCFTRNANDEPNIIETWI